jgi:hypothetical protein
MLFLHVLTSGALEDHSYVLPDSHIDCIYILFLHDLISGAEQDYSSLLSDIYKDYTYIAIPADFHQFYL